MKAIITIILSTISFSIVSCQKNEVEITSQLTEDHINIPPTKINIIPPEGFINSTNFIGIENEESGINIMEIDGAPFENSTRDLNRETFESQGIIVNRIDKIKVNKLSGYILELEQEYGSTQLIFGDSTYTVMLIGSYPKQNEKAKEIIENCLRTVYLNKEQITNPFDVAKFDIDLSKTNLEFYQYGANQYIYNSDKLESAYNHPTGATLTISQIPNNPSVTNNIKDYTTGIYLIMASEIDGLQLLEEDLIETEEMQSYYLLSNSMKGDKDLYLYVSMIVTSEISYYVNIISFSGLNENMENVIEAVRNLKSKTHTNNR